MFDKQFNYNEITNTWTVNLKPRYDHALPDDDEMDEDNNNNSIIKNTGDINIDTTTYFQQETQNITQNGEYIYEQNENGAWHLELKSQDSTEPTDVNINISIPPPTSNVLYMDYFYVSASQNSLPSDSNAEICTRERWNSTSSTSIKVPSKCTLILVYNNYPSSSEYISFSVLANNNSTSANVNLYSGGYYYITEAKSTAFIYLHIRSTDSNTDLGEITFCDPTRNDTSYYQMFLNKNYYTVDFSN